MLSCSPRCQIGRVSSLCRTEVPFNRSFESRSIARSSTSLSRSKRGSDVHPKMGLQGHSVLVQSILAVRRCRTGRRADPIWSIFWWSASRSAGAHFTVPGAGVARQGARSARIAIARRNTRSRLGLPAGRGVGPTISPPKRARKRTRLSGACCWRNDAAQLCRAGRRDAEVGAIRSWRRRPR